MQGEPQMNQGVPQPTCSQPIADIQPTFKQDINVSCTLLRHFTES